MSRITNRTRRNPAAGGPGTTLCAAVLAAALVLAGCSGAEPDRHGAGEKLTESAERGGANGSGDGGDAAGGDDGSSAGHRPSEDGSGGSGDEPDAGGAGPVGQRLPAVELIWLRPPGADQGSSGGPDPGSNGPAEPGDPVELPELTGKPLVINIWAVWCPPCRDEIPYFQQLSERAGDRVGVIGVDHDDEADAARDLLDELGVDYPQVADPEARLRAPFGLGLGIPVTVYVDPSGEIAHVARTPYRSLEQLRADVERHLDVSV